MNLNERTVLIIGGGVAGLSAAVGLGRFGINVELIEKEDHLGGHAGAFTCKAVDECVRCGACIVEEKITDALSSPRVTFHTGLQVKEVSISDRFAVSVAPKNGSKESLTADAIVVATGFSPFNPESKPYGYAMFDNVITNLELEHMLRQESKLIRPSDSRAPEKIAFIQCVGSRDEKLNHLWCSKVCCGSALRTARLIKSRQTELEIAFFYMDVQTFGKDFQTFYLQVQNDVKMIRAIPGDIYRTEDDRLMVNYFCAGNAVGIEEIFDMVVLSVGITPGNTNEGLAEMLNLKLENTGFFSASSEKGEGDNPAIFFAGTTKGPMSISDSVSDAGRVVLEVVEYLG